MTFLFVLDQELSDLILNKNVDDTLKCLIQNIMECVNRFAPEKPYKQKPASSWITIKIKNEIKSVTNYFRNGLKTPLMTIELSIKLYGIK